MHLFWEQGYEGTSLSDLTSRMGIGRQSLYDTFGDKKSLYHEAFRRYLSEQQRPALELLGGEGAPLDRIDRLFSIWIDTFGGDGCKGCMVANALAEFAGDRAEVTSLLDEANRRLEKAIRGALQEAADAGDLPAGRDPRALARTIAVSAHGLALMGRHGTTRRFVRDVVETLQFTLKVTSTND